MNKIPDPQIYLYPRKSPADQIVDPRMRFYIWIETRYPVEGGIRQYFKGLPFPQKGYPTPDTVWMNDVAKGLTMSFIEPLSTKAAIPTLIGFTVTPWKKKIQLIESFLSHYNRTLEKVLNQNYYQFHRYTESCQAIWNFTYQFLTAIGVSYENALSLARNIATMVEYDNAYRLPFQDVMSESNKVRLINSPQTEIPRLVEIYCERHSNPVVKSKIKMIGRVAKLLFKVKRFRKAWIAGWNNIDIDDMRMDQIDHYDSLLRIDYDFEGKPREERLDEWTKIHFDLGTPPTQTYAEMVKAINQ